MNQSEKAKIELPEAKAFDATSIRVNAMIEEYKMLWGEMNNRWNQQQQLIWIAWLVLAAGIGYIGTQLQHSQFNERIIETALIIPFALATLCGMFIRHEDKIWRIVGYIYIVLRRDVQNVIDQCDTQKHENMPLIWQWGICELPIAFKRRMNYMFSPPLDIMRYLMMLGPSAAILVRLSEYWRLSGWITFWYVLDLILLIVAATWSALMLLRWLQLLQEITKTYPVSGKSEELKRLSSIK